MATPQVNADATAESARDEISRRRLQMLKLHSAQQRGSAASTAESGDKRRDSRSGNGDAVQLSPFAISTLGLGSSRRQASAAVFGQDRGSGAEETIVPGSTVNVPFMPQPRTSRRAQSHYNTFQTLCTPANDDPPTYATAARQKPVTTPSARPGSEPLPKYSCTVSAEAKFLLNLEAVNPLHTVSEGEWREVYIILRGTALHIHRIKDSGPGKLVRSYTLQHAEVGLATDSSHTVLVPQTRLAHFIPTPARSKAFRKDPALFRPASQTILRLRIEGEQILLADSNEERIFQFIYAIASGIDLAPSIDERNASKQWTVPRRRRRPRPTPFTADVADPSVIAEQERILQRMYPAFAEQNGDAPPLPTPQLQRTESAQPPSTPAREEDEIDLSALREESDPPLTPTTSHQSQPSPATSRPAVSRSTTTTSATSTPAPPAPTSSDPARNFDRSGKWRPPHSRSQAQLQRYARRCLPILLADAPRASDVLIVGGRRVKIDWRREVLEEWSLKPPSYAAHGFGKNDDAEAQSSEREGNGSSLEAVETADSAEIAGANEVTRPSDNEDDFAITPVVEEPGFAGLELAKTETGEKKLESRVENGRTNGEKQGKMREVGRGQGDVHGVVFCF